MYRQRFEALLERKRKLLMARDVAGLVDMYATPMPVYHPNGLKVAATAKDLKVTIENIVARMDEIGVSEVKTRVLETHTAHFEGHFSAEVELRYFDRAGDPLRRSRITYFIQDGRHGLKIVMLEYLEAAFAEVFAEMRMRIS